MSADWIFLPIDTFFCLEFNDAIYVIHLLSFKFYLPQKLEGHIPSQEKWYKLYILTNAKRLLNNQFVQPNICNHWVSKRQVRPLHSHNPARAILELLCLFVYTIWGNRSWKIKHHIEGNVTEKSNWHTSRHGQQAQSVQLWGEKWFKHDKKCWCFKNRYV